MAITAARLHTRLWPQYVDSLPTVLWRLTIKIDGVTFFTNVNALVGFDLNVMYFGAKFSDSLNNYTLDNLLIGTTGFGSSNLFTYGFTGALVPPFDSLIGSGISISSGKLLLSSNPAVDGYVTKSISAATSSIYFRFDVNFDVSMDNGQLSPDVIDILDMSNELITGVYVDTSLNNWHFYSDAGMNIPISFSASYGITHTIDLGLILV